MARKNKLGQQCTAKSKTTGDRCGQPAKLGGKVCGTHGGKAPQVERANARRILEGLVGPALAQLRVLLDDEDVPSSVQYAAVRDVLDRTGFKPVDKVELSLSDDQLAAEIAALKAKQ